MNCSQVFSPVNANSSPNQLRSLPRSAWFRAACVPISQLASSALLSVWEIQPRPGLLFLRRDKPTPTRPTRAEPNAKPAVNIVSFAGSTDSRTKARSIVSRRCQAQNQAGVVPRYFLAGAFRSRTPGPPPFSTMNSTPACLSTRSSLFIVFGSPLYRPTSMFVTVLR
jgi:hypothetical protein